MTPWVSVHVAAALAAAIAWRMWRERRSPTSPPLIMRVSTLLFTIYAPFAWLPWFPASIDSRRFLLELWPAFPFAVPLDLGWGLMVHRRLEGAALSVAASLLAFGVAGCGLALMRRTWRALIATAVALTAVSIAISLLTHHALQW